MIARQHKLNYEVTFLSVYFPFVCLMLGDNCLPSNNQSFFFLTLSVPMNVEFVPGKKNENKD